MKSDFKFSNLLGTVYRQGNLVYTNDGTKLLSPVGNRVTCFELIKNKSFTFDFEHRRNISRISLNSKETLLISVDTDGRAILTNFITRKVLHHFNFKNKVFDIAFSHDGNYFAVACSRFIEVWKIPVSEDERQFSPFIKHRVYAGHFSEVTSVTWSQDSRFFLSTSKDLTSRIYSLNSEDSKASMVLAGHRDYTIKAFFNSTQEIIYTVSKDGALFQWEYTSKMDDTGDLEMEGEEEELNRNMSWRITAKNFFFADSNLISACFHPESNILVVGFGNGEFRLYELPDFTLIQQMSMGQNPINAISINKSGEWLAFGSSRFGQLLVYEWQSESYILKQQGHFDSTNALCYSPDGSRIATASDDGKIKIWDVVSGVCLMTFTDHSAAVTSVKFSKRGNVLFSCSLDGTIRAYDLIRFRNFRTFTGTKRIQYNSLALDPSGEIVVAGSHETFEIYVWSVQTGQLLDSLTGHEGPISCLSFGEENSILASASWDKTIRIWNIFGRNQTVEPIDISSDVLSLSLRPDSKEVAVSTLDGHLAFFNVEEGTQTHLIDCRKDIISGRYLEDRFTSKNSARSKFFTTISYSFDGNALIAGGTNNSLCLYDLKNEVLLKRFTVSQNMEFNGTQEYLNSKRLVEGNVLDLIDDEGENSDLEDRIDKSLPGSHRGDPGLRKAIAEIKVSSISFSPTSSSFAAASTEGLLIYSIDRTLTFDPFELDIDITPQATLEVLQEKDYLTALIMAFRINENYLIHKVLESVPVKDIPLVCAELPAVYLERFLSFLGELSIDSHNLEYNLIWISNILREKGQYITNNKKDFAVQLRLLRRFIEKRGKDILNLSRQSRYTQEYLKLAPKNDNSIQIITSSSLSAGDGNISSETKRNAEEKDEDEDYIHVSDDEYSKKFTVKSVNDMFSENSDSDES